jgi:phage-related protein
VANKSKAKPAAAARAKQAAPEKPTPTLTPEQERKEQDVFWMGSSWDDLMDFPEAMRREAGYQLSNVQFGIDPDDWAPMEQVGSGSKEIRMRDKDGWYRVIYVAKFESGVYVLHSFQKKTNQTSQSDIDLAKKRYTAAKTADTGSRK